jgi:hypothetical protein
VCVGIRHAQTTADVQGVEDARLQVAIPVHQQLHAQLSQGAVTEQLHCLHVNDMKDSMSMI